MATVFGVETLLRPEDLLFGQSPRPVSCGFGLTIGAGVVFPEVNFTLPAMMVSPETWSEVVAQYESMASGILKRAVALQVPGIVLEFELLPAMTETPEWGGEITALLARHLEEAHRKHGVKGALRVTPTDIREKGKPPHLREGQPVERVLASFEACLGAGGHILSIESVGGKEVHDHGLMYGDLRAIVLALGVLAPRDMAWLWDAMVAACGRYPGSIPGGDTACGFANTAMQLAHMKMLPEVLAAVVRGMSAARSLVAFERGAVGPSKDCGYEGPILKAITGCPIAMEGKSATCAHFSPLGNIAAAACDLWSNESVQNIKLLSGSAPEAFAELLAYDCRLMNRATARGGASLLRDWLVESDEWLSPQAAVLAPTAACRIGRTIAAEPDPYRRTVAAGLETVAILREGQADGRLTLARKEATWLDRIERELGAMPATAEALVAETHSELGSLYHPASYGLE
jgi:methanol--5-hydroxybenzimidazolylcobamide Co-methyltransferase